MFNWLIGGHLIFAGMYPLLRRIFFLFEAEKAHYLAMDTFKFFCSIGFLRKLLSKQFFIKDENLNKHLLGLNFRNAVGLGAGFDKNALYIRELETMGFGFIEIGTVTPKPQTGNEKPRLFRLQKDAALINRMGFNNDGVAVVAERLRKWQDAFSEGKNKNPKMLIGGNIGKNKSTPNEEAWKDYEICFTALHAYVDFFVVNVSSPNTPGLRALQEKESLRKILLHLQMINNGKAKAKPILLKIAPDLTVEQIDDVIALAEEIKLDGIVATNTTVSRQQLVTTNEELEMIGAGGLSGKPLEKRSTEIVHYIHQQTNGSIPIIGSGGIFTATDALKKIAAGADLIEVWTGFIYEGPFIAKNICKALKN